MNKLLIKNGTIVNADEVKKSDILIVDGKISEIAENVQDDNAEILDASGKYVLYTFHTEEKYAKVLDCALENFSYLTVDIEVYYYKKDAHIVVNHTAIVERMDKRTEYKKSGKIYTYKKLIS